MSSEQIFTAVFSMQVSQTGEADLSFDCVFKIEANQQNIPMSYLLNLQLLQKRERGDMEKDLLWILAG